MEYSQHQKPQQYQLPPGWEEAFDPTTGRAYYANATTGASSWDKPQQLPFPPPPPPPPPLLKQSFPHQQHAQHNINLQISNSSYSHSDQRYWDQNPSNVNHSSAANQRCLSNPQQMWPTESTQGSHAAQESNSVKSDSINNIVITSRDTTIKEELDPIDNELQLLSAGQISDLCYIQQQQQQQQLYNENNGTGSSMPPPYSVPLSIMQQQQRPRQEIGRLQTRYYTLRETLKQFHVTE